MQSSSISNQPVYIKLGGSLITDKRKPETARLDVLARLAAELAEARRLRPELQLILGHGSGSFGHVVGEKYGTRSGVRTPHEWYGFAATADAAARLNRIVTGALLAAHLPVWSLQPGVAVYCADGRIETGPEMMVQRALARGLVPLLFGDVALDSVRGGTIISTEELFAWLTKHIFPKRMLLLGEVDGIFSADPLLDSAALPIPSIGPEDEIEALVGRSYGVDVTGGMAEKVRQALDLVSTYAGLEVVICSGLIPGQLLTTLTDPEQHVGTRIHG